MGNQSLSKLTPEQQEKIINNTVDAVQILFNSVMERVEKEMVSERIKKGIKFKNEKYKNVQV